jgi:hypothetical protein
MKHAYLVSLVTILLFACGGGSIADPRDAEQVKARIAELADEIQQVIGVAACSQDDQCASVAMGNKACGGPQFYLAYSTVDTDVNRLTSLAAEHRNASKQYNQLLGLISDCAFVMEPPVACMDNKCQIKK